jgi:hypothetical protein
MQPRMGSSGAFQMQGPEAVQPTQGRSAPPGPSRAAGQARPPRMITVMMLPSLAELTAVRSQPFSTSRLAQPSVTPSRAHVHTLLPLCRFATAGLSRNHRLRLSFCCRCSAGGIQDLRRQRTHKLTLSAHRLSRPRCSHRRRPRAIPQTPKRARVYAHGPSSPHIHTDHISTTTTKLICMHPGARSRFLTLCAEASGHSVCPLAGQRALCAWRKSSLARPSAASLASTPSIQAASPVRLGTFHALLASDHGSCVRQRVCVFVCPDRSDSLAVVRVGCQACTVQSGC